MLARGNEEESQKECAAREEKCAQIHRPLLDVRVEAFVGDDSITNNDVSSIKWNDNP